MPFHDAFWRGKTRNELVAKKVFDLPLFVAGDPDASYIIAALEQRSAGKNSTSNSLIAAYFSLAKAGEDEITVLRQWIIDGCPEIGINPEPKNVKALHALTADVVNDDRHVEYWRAIDIFFLPGLASGETLPHVIKMHGTAFEVWIASMITLEDPARWPAFLVKPEVIESFTYIRHHQRRLIHEYYGESQSNIFDSLWKFGGSLLPIDPLSRARPEHRMNSVLDWFYWVPYLTASLTAPDIEQKDVDLARAWQIGLVADGLLREDEERPVGSRMPISDFAKQDPDLFSKVSSKYQEADHNTLLKEMIRRAKESGIFG